MMATYFRNAARGSTPLWCAIAMVVATIASAEKEAALDAPGETVAYVYVGEEALLAAHAPVFLIEHNELAYNRIGTPSARIDENGKEDIYIDPERATVYHQIETFKTDKGTYTNLIYRIHFEESPFTWQPFNASAGKNVGAMAVITLDEMNHPVLLTTVQSCGCYHAITPTSYLKSDVYPEDWSNEPVENYGETLPGRLDFPADAGADLRIAVRIRSGTHRTMGISLMALSNVKGSYPTIEAVAAPMGSLKAIPLGEGNTSFYYESGQKRGLVKGAAKPWERLLFGLWSWDSHVGQDREYASKEDSGHRFYTTLRAGQKKEADMWDYAGYLRHNGWRP